MAAVRDRPGGARDAGGAGRAGLRGARQIGQLPLASGSRDIAVHGAFAYLATQSAGLSVIDVSVPTAPRLVATLDPEGSAVGVAVGGGFAYVADESGGLQIFQVGEAPLTHP